MGNIYKITNPIFSLHTFYKFFLHKTSELGVCAGEYLQSPCTRTARRTAPVLQAYRANIVQSINQSVTLGYTWKFILVSDRKMECETTGGAVGETMDGAVGETTEGGAGETTGGMIKIQYF